MSGRSSTYGGRMKNVVVTRLCIKLAAGRDSVMMGDAVTQLLAASANFL